MWVNTVYTSRTLWYGMCYLQDIVCRLRWLNEGDYLLHKLSRLLDLREL